MTRSSSLFLSQLFPGHWGVFVPWERVTTHFLVLADLNTTWDLILWLSQSQEGVVDILFHPMLKIILQLLPSGTSFKNF